MTHFVVSEAAVRSKYGSHATKILQAVQLLGPTFDVSGKTPQEIQALIAALPPNEAVCLVGGYDLLAPFFRSNPTVGPSDDDADIPTDAPYGATPGQPAQDYAPVRPVSRIPDGADADAPSFLSILNFQRDATTAATPAGTFEEAAKEFAGALKFVRKSIPAADGTPRLSPPNDQQTPGLTAAITQRGRVHILLHGANFDPDWAYLWGHDGDPHAPFVKALSAQLLDLCDLRGSVITFSSCYAAMLDTEPAHSGARTAANQVALACLAHGAKMVFGATRSNWIAIRTPFDGYGPALVAATWKQLGKGVPAAEALRLAKRDYLQKALAGDPADRPYALKTVLQAQCYGNPTAVL